LPFRFRLCEVRGLGLLLCNQGLLLCNNRLRLGDAFLSFGFSRRLFSGLFSYDSIRTLLDRFIPRCLRLFFLLICTPAFGISLSIEPQCAERRNGGKRGDYDQCRGQSAQTESGPRLLIGSLLFGLSGPGLRFGQCLYLRQLPLRAFGFFVLAKHQRNLFLKTLLFTGEQKGNRGLKAEMAVFRSVLSGGVAFSPMKLS
jgi:hypothetical protein